MANMDDSYMYKELVIHKKSIYKSMYKFMYKLCPLHIEKFIYVKETLLEKKLAFHENFPSRKTLF